MQSVVSTGIRRSAAIWTSVVVMALPAAGCSSSSPSDPSPSAAAAPSTGTPSSAAPSPSPADAAGQSAVAAYLGMWGDLVVASETSNWQDARLGQHATAIALTNLTRGLFADKSNGFITKGQPKNAPTVSSAEPPNAPTKVIIADCGDDSQWQHYRSDNGQPANDGPSGRRQINAVVEKQQDGAWRVTDFGIHEVGTC